MNGAERQALWLRLAEFAFDEPQAEVPFSQRLARQNGWSRSFTQRVIEEYRRFLLLAVAAEHVACPSEEVDEAWHLHLTYTRSYWEDLCQGVLRRPLHHGPSRGGADESLKYRSLYERTLDTYRTFFASEPPADIWPAAQLRFGRVTEYRRIDLRRNWVLPKIQIASMVRRFAGLSRRGVFAAGPLALLAFINPLNLPGPQFLLFYALCYAVGLIVSIGLRRWFLSTATEPPKLELQPYELAGLAGGERYIMCAAIAKLVSEGHLHIDPADTGGRRPRRYFFKAAAPLPAGAHRIEQLMYGAAQQDYALLTDLQHAAKEEAHGIALDLERRGLMMSPEATAGARIWPAIILGAVAALGVWKIVIGYLRGRPIGWLVLFCLLTLITIAIFLQRPHRTFPGERLLKEHRRRHDRLKRLNKHPDAQATEEVQPAMAHTSTLAVALFGPAVLSGTMLDPVREAWTAHYPQGDGGGFSVSGSDGGGDGGGGGCGGCGD